MTADIGGPLPAAAGPVRGPKLGRMTFADWADFGWAVTVDDYGPLDSFSVCILPLSTTDDGLFSNDLIERLARVHFVAYFGAAKLQHGGWEAELEDSRRITVAMLSALVSGAATERGGAANG